MFLYQWLIFFRHYNCEPGLSTAQVDLLTNVSAYSGYALKRDGTVWAWGVDSSPTWTQRADLGNDVIAVDGFAALKRDGIVWVWGYNTKSQMGNGTVDEIDPGTGSPPSHPAQPVPGLSNVIAISSGSENALALKSDGTLWAWGSNFNGQVGKTPTVCDTQFDSYVFCQPVPVPVGLSDVIAIQARGESSFALTSDGTVWGWGDRWPPLLSNPPVCAHIFFGPWDTEGVDIKCFPTPIPVAGLSHNVIAIDIDGYGAFAALDGDGRLWWTSLVDPGTPSSPFILSSMSGLSDVFAFTGWGNGLGTHSAFCAIKRDGTIWRKYDNQQLVRFSNINAHDDCGAGSPVLTVTKTGAGAGRVTSNPAGIDCGVDCAESYKLNTVVTLTAAPHAGSTFTGWSGCATNPTPQTCTVTLDSDKVVTASFGRPTLTVFKAGSGGGLVTSSPTGINCGVECAETYYANTTAKVTLTAAPYAGSTLAGWSGACSGAAATCTVTMSASRSVTARFNTTTAGKTALTLYKNGVGLGTVTSTPAGLNCGTTCTTGVANFATGATVTLTATAATGSTFAGWGGACTGTGPCRVTLTAGRTVTATFTRPVLTVRKTGSGLVTSTPAGINCGPVCTAPYNLTDPPLTVTLTATPATGYRFSSWNGCTPKPGAPLQCTVPMNQSRTVTANFIR